MKIFEGEKSQDWNQQFLTSPEFRKFQQAVDEIVSGFDGDLRHLAYALTSEVNESILSACIGYPR